MFGDMTEILIKSLKDQAEKAERYKDGSITIKPRKANFDELVITLEKVFIDTRCNFVASINIVGDLKTKDDLLKKLANIGSFRYELSWKKKGLFAKKPFFKALETNMPSSGNVHSEHFESDYKFTSFLNSEERISKKIRKVKPDELFIDMVWINAKPSSSTKGKKGSSLAMHIMPQVTLLVSLSMILYRSISFTKKVQAIFDLLDDISARSKFYIYRFSPETGE